MNATMNEVKWEPVPNHGILLTRQAWLDQLTAGWITENDGTGYFATETMMSNLEGAFGNEFDWPEWATHVAWFAND
jgi:hypothetical protein